MLKEFIFFGVAIPTYELFLAIALLATFFFDAWHGKHYNLLKKQSVIATALAYAMIFASMLILAWAESGFKNWGSKNIVRSFVYVPLFAILIGKLMKIPAKKMCDFFAPCFGFCVSMSRFACVFNGCCYGYACSWGTYNQSFHVRLFPVQIFETVTAFVVTYITYRYAKKQQFSETGKVYPLFLILFGITRFFWEFFRDNTKLIFGMSSFALHALFMAAVGAIALYIIICNDKHKGGMKLKKS